MAVDKKHIRNFSIIAHIDHGKSTLADRLLELTSSVATRDMQAQILDDMDLERERGITIKAHAVKLDYTAENGELYEFNLIDTPGHVDFNYEVSRSLAACEGAILIVDASQGVEAQTLANTYLALDHDLDILPVINKIDLPAADPERVAEEVEEVVGIPCLDAPRVSAKTGENVEEVLEYIVNEIAPPVGDDSKPLRALIFDSIYDSYRGVIVYVRVMDGKLKAGDTMRMMATGAQFTVVEVGYMRATSMEKTDELCAGEVGYITASIKTVSEARVGDTVTLANNPAAEALPGYRKVNPMVFCGVYPADGADYENLRDALEKLQLNDASLSYEPETSGALGFGFRCGFLGLLHLEIIEERLEREYNLDLITTVPSVIYKIHLTDGTMVEIDNPTNYPDPAYIDYCEEPFANAHVYVPSEFVGTVMDMCQERRGIFKDMNYITPDRVDIHYELPLNEIIYDFFDALKSRTRGYASFDYEIADYRRSDLCKVDVLLNGDVIDALSFIIHREKAYS
ncbi:MAG: translation elongation factor 4, partial [Eubacterium sp.]|nr:translation elongation factor 4 [Eubacterium sp.]